MNLLAYPAFLTTFLSVSGLSYLAWKKHIPAMTKPLSKLAVEDAQSLRFFRVVLITCSTLFAVSMYGFVIPKAGSNGLQFVAWTLTYISALLLALLPARGKTLPWHNLFAGLMCIGMLGSAMLFSLSTDLSAWCRELCRYVSILMVASAVMLLIDNKRFVFYELAFIFLAHTSIILAVLSLLTS